MPTSPDPLRRNRREQRLDRLRTLAVRGATDGERAAARHHLDKALAAAPEPDTGGSPVQVVLAAMADKYRATSTGPTTTGSGAPGATDSVPQQDRGPSR